MADVSKSVFIFVVRFIVCKDLEYCACCRTEFVNIVDVHIFGYLCEVVLWVVLLWESC